MLTSMMAALQNGNISELTWHEYLQKQELVPSTRSLEEEKEMISKSNSDGLV